MRRVDLETPDPQREEFLHLALGIGSEPRVDPAVRDQAVRRGTGVVGGEPVRLHGEAHHVGARIVHEARTPDVRAIEDLQEGRRVVHDRAGPLRLGAQPAAHDLGHRGLELAPGLNVDVQVGDARRRGRHRRAAARLMCPGTRRDASPGRLARLPACRLTRTRVRTASVPAAVPRPTACARSPGRLP